MGDSANTYYASSTDVNIVRNVFVPSYTFNGSSGQFEVQLDTNLRGNVAVGDSNTNYSLKVNGSIVQTQLPTGNNYGDYLLWDGTQYVIGDSNVAIGANAREVSSEDGGVSNAIAIGSRAGYQGQETSAIAIGAAAGIQGQKNEAIAIGAEAGSSQQGCNSIAIGANAGVNSQISNSIILNAMGTTLDASVNSGFYVAPIRNLTTLSSLYYNPSTKEITYGVSPSGGGTTLPPGRNYGDYLYWNGSAYVVGGSDVNIGSGAGSSKLPNYSVAVGANAGVNQAAYAVAIGFEAGQIQQGPDCVAIGVGSGQTSQELGAVSVGYNAGGATQRQGGVAIGFTAGNYNQGSNSIAIGYSAGYQDQISNSIILNALGGDFTSPAYKTVSGFYVAPIRNATALSSLYYNYVTKEITYGLSPSGGGVTLPSGINPGDYLVWNGIEYVVGDQNIKLGGKAGMLQQSINSIAIGASAGYFNQGIPGSGGSNAIAIGLNAGTMDQGTNSIAIGANAGSNVQGQYSIAIGASAGTVSQSTRSIIMNASGSALNAATPGFYVAPVRNLQGPNSIYYDPATSELTYGTIPSGGGGTTLPPGINTGDYLYWSNGAYQVGDTKVTIGANTGVTSQGANAVAIGVCSGNISQGANAVSIGMHSDTTYPVQSNQGPASIGIGRVSGQINQGGSSVAIGDGAGYFNQSGHAVAVGFNAGLSGQGVQSVAIGWAAGSTNQGNGAQYSYGVAIGCAAAISNQGQLGIAIGNGAGRENQGVGAIALGSGAGGNFQPSNSIAIGVNAGTRNSGITTGVNSIVIGTNAAATGQGNSTIIVNATGGDFVDKTYQTQSNSLFIAPIRTDITTAGLCNVQYNLSTKEITVAPVNVQANVLFSTLASSNLPNAAFGWITPTFKASSQNPNVYLNASSNIVFGSQGYYQIIPYISSAWKGTLQNGQGPTSISIIYIYGTNAGHVQTGPVVLSGVQTPTQTGYPGVPYPSILYVDNPGRILQLGIGGFAAGIVNPGVATVTVPANAPFILSYLGNA
jgi:hypothetical protein